MNRTRQTFELARRDFVQRARSKAFLTAMLLTVGIVVMIGPILSMIDQDSGPTYVGLVGELPPGTGDSILLQAGALDMDVAVMSFTDMELAEQAIADGEISVAVNSLDELVFRENVQPRLAALAIGGVAAAQRGVIAAEMGLSPSEVDSLLLPVDFSQRTLEPAETDEDQARQAGALAGLLLLYMSLLMFGQFVMMGIMEEKQTRVVEVVLSRVRPTQILVGKVVGIGLLGLIQILALGASAIFTLSIVDIADINITDIGIKVFGILVLWYLLGYMFYSFLYGTLGATISRQEDMQGVAMLPVLLILPGFFLGQMALVNPDTLLVRIASFIPVWSPMVMGVRVTVSTVPTWELAVSILLILLTTYALLRLGGRIYRGAILHSGAKVKLRTAWRSAAQ
ncbi:MAG: ABC transporter permease [Actinomycetota bacterium]|nr:ABC transporter permease [Actinomycetota bacterium]